MFVYEKGNSLNLTFKGSLPVDNPEVVIKGYKNGAALIVNGTTYGVENGEEFEGKAPTFAFERDGNLLVTFRGIAGMNNPEVVLNEDTKGTVDVVVSGVSVTVKYTEDSVYVENTTDTTNNMEPSDVPENETPEVVEEEIIETEDEDEEEPEAE